MHQMLKQVLNGHLAQSIGVSAYFRANFCEALISCFVRLAIGLPGGRPEAPNPPISDPPEKTTENQISNSKWWKWTMSNGGKVKKLPNRDGSI